MLKVIARLYVTLYRTFSRKTIKEQHVMLWLMGGRTLIPYVYNWNRYIWKDADSHTLFWKYHKLHKLIFKNSDFEIEIKKGFLK